MQQGNANKAPSYTMLVWAAVFVVSLCCTGRYTMARKVIGSTNNALVTVGSATPAAQAPQQAAATPATGSQLAVIASNGTAQANWQLVGSPSTAKQATNGVGPAPAPGTVGYAALQAIALGGSQGCTLATMQAAVTAVGRKGKHPVMPLLRWLAKNRGYTFVCSNGYVTLG